MRLRWHWAFTTTSDTGLWPRWFYLRILAVGFIAGFLSLSTQIHGLIGPQGILPARQFLQAIASHEPGWRRFLLVPSILWWNSGPAGLDLLCAGGFIAALLLFLNIWPRATLFLCWLFYLSFVSVARDFSGFQSDGLMLESALLAIFLAPRGFRPGMGEGSPPSAAALFVMRWLLFRLLFESGMVKLLSGDVGWRHFSAMDDYYVNCPFPSWIGWYAQQLPHAFHACTVGLAFLTELVCPLMIFQGRRWRIPAFGIVTLFQTGILLTGNYTFLNYNTIALAFLLLDDQDLHRWIRLRVPATRPELPPPFWKKIGAGAVLTFLFYVSTVWLLGIIGLPLGRLPRWVLRPLEWSVPFRSANHYGLFAVMTHERNQIEFEGSDDGGATWRTYELKWQPQKLNVPPRFMAPHLPRFDWNLWFANLGSWQDYPFVQRTAVRLLQGEPTVTGLFARNPFPGKPPSTIRFARYRYQFTDLETLRSTGCWWKRERIADYAPAVFRDSFDGKIKWRSAQ